MFMQNTPHIWEQVIAENWDLLRKAKSMLLPKGFPHPRNYWPFYPIYMAEDVGQAENYGISFGDGSRIHVHVFSDGRLSFHREIDPAKSPLHLAAHLLFETKIGKTAVIGGAVYGIYRLLKDD